MSAGKVGKAYKGMQVGPARSQQMSAMLRLGRLNLSLNI